MRASILTDRLSTAAVYASWALIALGVGVAAIVLGAATARGFDALPGVIGGAALAALGVLELIAARRFRAAHRRAVNAQR